MSQTAYNTSLAIARAGLPYAQNPSTNVTGLVSSKMYVVVTPTAANGGVYNVTINGTLATYTGDGSATAAEISAGVVAAIQALSGYASLGVVAADLTGTYSLVSSTASLDFTYVFSGTGVQTADEKVGAAQVLPFGCFACIGDSEEQVRLPYQATDITGRIGAGVALATQAIVTNPNITAAAYSQKDAATLMERGQVWVQVEEAVSPGDQAYVRFATGSGGSQKGAFRKSADTTTAAALANSRYKTAASAAGFAVLELGII